MKTNCEIQTNKKERALMLEKKTKVLLIMADKEASDALERKLSGCCEISLLDNPLICKGTFVDDDTDVIVIDERVGDIYGREICFRIKSDEQLCDIPVILFISSGESESYLSHIKFRANRLLPKDIHPDILKADIQMLVDNSNIYRERIKQLKMKTIFATIPEKTLKEKRNLELIEKVYQLLDEYPPSKKHLVGQLCKDVNMSQSNFYARIKKITGHSPEYLVNEYKMRKAAELILQQHELLDIALQLGYSDTKYFGKKFKSYHHICPSRYLESLLECNDEEKEEVEN